MTKVHKKHVFQGKNGNWYWRAAARNGEPIATSGEGYEHKAHAVDMAEALHSDVPVFIEEYEDGPSDLVAIRLVPIEVFGENDCCLHNRLPYSDRPAYDGDEECESVGYGLIDAVPPLLDCNRAEVRRTGSTTTGLCGRQPTRSQYMSQVLTCRSSRSGSATDSLLSSSLAVARRCRTSPAVRR